MVNLRKLIGKTFSDPVAPVVVSFTSNTCSNLTFGLINPFWGSEVCLKIVWHWKSLEQSLQTNGFSTQCILMSLLRLLESENDLKHSLQVNIFSPEWVLQWVLRFPDNENDL